MAEPVTVFVAAACAGAGVAVADGEGDAEAEAEADGVGVLVAPDVPAVAAEVAACTDVSEAVTCSPIPYSLRPTVAPIVTRITVKRMVPRQDLLFMTCSVLLGG
jgi:hypothetical protein